MFKNFESIRKALLINYSSRVCILDRTDKITFEIDTQSHKELLEIKWLLASYLPKWSIVKYRKMGLWRRLFQKSRLVYYKKNFLGWVKTSYNSSGD